MGRIVKVGKRFFIQNTRNKVLGRSFRKRDLAIQALIKLRRRR